MNRKTWAPRGQTPVQRAWDRYDRLSVIGAVTLSPQRRQISTPFQIHTDNIRTAEAVAFIKALRNSFRGPLIIVLDRWSVHRAAAKRVETSRVESIEFEWLPPYSPELNPDEYLNGDLKQEINQDRLPNSRDELKQRVQRVMNMFANLPQHIAAYFQHPNIQYAGAKCGLSSIA